MYRKFELNSAYFGFGNKEAIETNVFIIVFETKQKKSYKMLKRKLTIHQTGIVLLVLLVTGRDILTLS